MATPMTEEQTRDVRMNELSSFAEQAMDDHDNAIIGHSRAVKNLLAASEQLAIVEARRAQLKLEAIARICEQDHPATPGRKFSASAADDFAQIDPQYAAYKTIVTNLQRSRLEAEKAVEDAAFAVTNARLRAELAIALVRVEGGLR